MKALNKYFYQTIVRQQSQKYNSKENKTETNFFAKLSKWVAVQLEIYFLLKKKLFAFYQQITYNSNEQNISFLWKFFITIHYLSSSYFVFVSSFARDKFRRSYIYRKSEFDSQKKNILSKLIKKWSLSIKNEYFIKIKIKVLKSICGIPNQSIIIVMCMFR